LLGQDTGTIEQVRRRTGVDPKRAEQTYSAAVGTLLCGLEAKSQTKEGAGSLWEMLRKHVEQGNIPAEAPAEMPTARGRVQTREIDQKTANEILKEIFGKVTPQVEGSFAKVVTLDPETSREVFAKVLPSVLGGIFGAAERAPEDGPRILGNARAEMEQRQPKSAGVFAAIFDRDHDGDVDLEDLADLIPKKPK
jgi:hypothetical protein